jgi:hypothetical protein
MIHRAIEIQTEPLRSRITDTPTDEPWVLTQEMPIKTGDTHPYTIKRTGSLASLMFKQKGDLIFIGEA